MKKFSPLILSLLVLFLSSCTKKILTGTGDIITETRILPAFSSFVANDNHQIEIIYAPRHKVELDGYENLVSGYLAKVENGRLYFEYANFKQIENDNIKLRIYTPSLDSLFTTANANLVLTSGYNTSNFLVAMENGSMLHASDGTIDKMDITVKDGAGFFAEPLEAKEARIVANGDAALDIRVTEKVLLQLSGNAVVHYWGSAPTEDISLEDQARLIRH